jgi:hypothetical protein
VLKHHNLPWVCKHQVGFEAVLLDRKVATRELLPAFLVDMHQEDIARVLVQRMGLVGGRHMYLVGVQILVRCSAEEDSHSLRAVALNSQMGRLLVVAEAVEEIEVAEVLRGGLRRLRFSKEIVFQGILGMPNMRHYGT